ncbi:MAG: carbon-nitrogen family hydrolase, partial [Clostridium sp.]|nr:carbon-nitrogen family hydrolase [Clostridium sp.]
IISCKVGEASITPFICYDLRFPEIFQIASKKSEIIIVIASWPKEREEHWVTLLKARAIENQCFIIGVNRVGEGDGLEYSGASLIFDPLGNSLNEKINKEELIIKDINLSSIKEVREKINIKRDRREKLYKESEVKLYENRLE